MIYNGDILELCREIQLIENDPLENVQQKYNCDTKEEIIALINEEINTLLLMNEEYECANYEPEEYYHYLD